MKQLIAYQGSAFVIEWFFDQGMKSQPLEYFLKLKADRQDQVLKLFKLMGERGRINNLSFGFISLSIRDLSAILPSVFLRDSAFGYDFRKSGGNLIENLS